MTTLDKLREFVIQWGQKGMFDKKLYSDLTALISEHYIDKDIHERLVERADELTTQVNESYPKEFTEWVGQNNAILCYVNIRKIWVRTRFVLGENPHEEYDEYTTEELFEYWKINEQ